MRRIRLLFLSLVLSSALVVSAAADSDWPRTFTADGNQLVATQPQLDTWTNRIDFTGRVAVTVTPQGGAPATGVLRIAARTTTDPATREVVLHDVRITDAQFPSATPTSATPPATLARALLPSDGLTLPLDYLLAALVQAGESAVSTPLATTPPAIFLAEQPARLVQFDGAPVFAAVPGTTLQHAVNTNWPLLRSSDGPALYLLDATGWLTSETLESGIWMYATQLPASFAQVPDTAQWQDVRQSLSAPATEGQAPLLIFVATTPAELIVIAGKPQYQQVPGTGISAVTNTDSLVFWDGYAKAFYYLVAGRWFRAEALKGPWTAATGELPADFANLPAEGPLAAVRASVPGTIEAREAALQAQIPHLATVSRSLTATVAYDGAPQFAPIDGTALSYAVNTASDVLRVGDAYYLCQNGVWFTAAAPAGPWAVATAVPEPIYAIPPSAPLYHVTFVRLYDVSADQVVSGYTGGYLGAYVADGVVAWGTGYAYAPYVGSGAVPVYYARPYTYGCDAYYDPRTGTFHRAGYGYGPHGGIAAGAAYDPATGTYVRGAAVHGPVESGAAVQAYNPRTGTVAAGATRTNPYAAWEQGVVYGPRRAIQVGAVADDRGSAARVQTERGAEAVAVEGENRQATVVRAPGGDWYAGGDGTVYQRTDAGWQRAETAIPGLGRAVDAGGYAGESRYVPSRPVAPGGYAGESREVPSRPVAPGAYAGESRYVPSREVSSGLDAEYAARQRQLMLTQQRLGGYARGNFGALGGARYGGRRR